MNYNMQFQPPMGLQTPEQKQMGMFLHLSQLLNVIIPIAGILSFCVCQSTIGTTIPALDAHGKMIANFMLSCLIYAVVSFILMFVLVGILGFITLAVIGVVFPIIGGIKANNGELWEYPLTIKFLK